MSKRESESESESERTRGWQRPAPRHRTRRTLPRQIGAVCGARTGRARRPERARLGHSVRRRRRSNPGQIRNNLVFCYYTKFVERLTKPRTSTRQRIQSSVS